MKLTGPTDKARGLLLTHVWLVILATCVAVGAAVAAAADKPVTYTATTEVVVSPVQTDKATVQPDMGTERAIAQSGVVVDSGALALGVDDATVRAGLSVSVVPQTLVLRIGYTASTPSVAFEGANVLASAYVTYRNSPKSAISATLVTPPTVPASGSRGNLLLFVALGLVAGLTVGIAAAWLWDRVSDRIRSVAELRDLSGLAILARLPRWDSRRSPVPAEGRPRESMAFVAARLTSLAGQDLGRTVVVTAPRAGAGATTVACGTAVALADQGKKVVLVAASRAGLSPYQALGGTTPPGPGKVSSRDGNESIQHPTIAPNLSLIKAGGAAGEGLRVDDLRKVLDRFDSRTFVVIDAPPVLTSADALLLADLADLVVVVGDLRSGTRTDLRETLALLVDVEPRLAGWVANVPRRRRTRTALPSLVRALRPGLFRSGPRTASTPSVTSPAGQGPDPVGPDRDRPVPTAATGRRRPDRRPPDAPRTGTPPRDGVRPVRAPYAAARRR
jgi:receptor protein-tyrosine kinase